MKRMYKSTGEDVGRMSIRANPRTAASATNGTNLSTPATPISFKDEFVHSTAALAASHDETVSHILSRLDQLQAKIQTQPEQNNNNNIAAAAPRATPAGQQRTIAAAAPTDSSVHARLANLESISESTLSRLSSQLDSMDHQLRTNRESEKLMTQIASRLQQVEPKLREHANMGDRLARIESQLQSHVSRVANLEARSDRPDPEQARILSRINSKLDLLEEQQRSAKTTNLGAAAYRKPEPVAPRASDSRRSLDTGNSHAHLDAEMDKQERAKYLQTRIEKLKELRNKYENADAS